MEDERRRRMCTGKKRFRDEVAALVALRIIAPWGRPDEGSPELRAYRCDYCQRWHFTSQRL